MTHSEDGTVAEKQQGAKAKPAASIGKDSSRKKPKYASADRDDVPFRHFAPHLAGLLPDGLRAFLLRSLGKMTSLTSVKDRTKPYTNGQDGTSGLPADSETHLSPIVQATFHESLPAALQAYQIFNRPYPLAAQELDADMLSRAVDFGYLGWPRYIREYVQDKDVLDVGCGTGIHGIGYVVVGVKSYTGMDPTIKLDRDRTKNLRERKLDSFGWTPRQIMNQFSRIKLVPGTFEEFDSRQTFDVAVLHNVTEHLLNIDAVLHSVASRLRDDGIVLFHHHNFYCWNGHHHRPKTIDQIDAGDPEQKNYLDWAHIRFSPPKGHYFHRGLNKIRLDELKELVERDYDIEVWKELPSSKRNGGGRLTEDIVARFPELSMRDLQIHNVFCIARRKQSSSV